MHFEHREPAVSAQALPVLVDSPHSGRYLPETWRLACCPVLLRQRTEDCFIDALCADAPDLGAHFVAATTARAYLDVNRPLTSIRHEDLKDFARALTVKPEDVNARNGRGLYWRVCMAGPVRLAIVKDSDKPTEAELLGRIREIWTPYHARLGTIMHSLRRQHGVGIHFNMHAFYPKGGMHEPEIVVGDLKGKSCAPELTARVVEHFRGHGYRTAVNAPYPGGEIIRRTGKPAMGHHAIQIEIRKDLYMDPMRIEMHAGFDRMRSVIANLMAATSKADIGVPARHCNNA